MVRALAPLLLLLASLGWCQTAPPRTLFETIPADASLVIRRHSSGADLVELTVVKAGYDPQLLKRQINAMAAEVGKEPRGLRFEEREVLPGQAPFLKASFAVDGLQDPPTGTIHLTAIARAFAGEAKGLTVIFEGLKATPKHLRAYRDEHVAVEGIRTTDPVALEYRIHLISSDPAKISIPDTAVVPPPAKPEAAPPARDWTWPVLIAVAALAVGALVYSFLLRSARPRSPQAPKR